MAITITSSIKPITGIISGIMSIGDIKYIIAKITPMIAKTFLASPLVFWTWAFETLAVRSSPYLILISV